MKQEEVVSQIIESIVELQDELDAPKISNRLDEIIAVLREDIDISLRADKVRELLDDLDEHPQLPDYARPTIWSLTAMLALLEPSRMV